MQTVAFLGLGVMGRGMASRLIDAEFPVTAWNRSPSRVEPLQRKGATAASSPAEAAAAADVIVSMVADDGASREVWLGAQGALASARAGTTFSRVEIVPRSGSAPGARTARFARAS